MRITKVMMRMRLDFLHSFLRFPSKPALQESQLKHNWLGSLFQMEQSASTIAFVGLVHMIGVIYWYPQIVGGLQHPDCNLGRKKKGKC